MVLSGRAQGHRGGAWFGSRGVQIRGCRTEQRGGAAESASRRPVARNPGRRRPGPRAQAANGAAARRERLGHGAVGAGSDQGDPRAGLSVADGANLSGVGGAVCPVRRTPLTVCGGRQGGDGVSECAGGAWAGKQDGQSGEEDGASGGSDKTSDGHNGLSGEPDD